MPPALHLLFIVSSLACFLIATTTPGAPYWNRLVSGGLALLVASMITW